MACDADNTVTEDEMIGLNSNLETIDVVVESSLDTTTTKNGKTINTLLGQLKLLGYIPPLVYAGGIVFGVSDNTKAIEYLGTKYAPLPSALPFTTSGTWVGDDELKFEVVQGLVSGDSSSLIAYDPQFTGSAPTTVEAKLSGRLSIFDFLSAEEIDDVVARTATLDVTAGILAWRTAVLASGREGWAPAGRYKYSTSIVISSQCTIVGEVNGIDNAGEDAGTVFLKDGNFIGIEVTNSSGPTLRDFSIDSLGGADASQGIKLTQCGRAKLSRITAINQGSHGIEFNNGNLTSFRDIYCLTNTDKGLYINGDTVPDTNACVFSNTDARGNGGIGVDIENAWNVFGNFATQSNDTGIRINNCRGSEITIYSENSTTADIELTSHTNLEGNHLTFAFYNSVIDNQAKPEQNTILRLKEGADTRTIFDYMNAKIHRIPVEGAITGSTSLSHPSNAQTYRFFDETSQSQDMAYKNVGGLADPINDTALFPVTMTVEGGAWYSTRQTLTVDSATPNVTLGQFWLLNNTGGAPNVTSFAGGINGQPIYVMSNNGNTTLTHSGTTTGLRLKSGVNEALGQYEGKSFIRAGVNWWIEV